MTGEAGGRAMRVARLLAALALCLPAGCAQGQDGLFGRYEAYGPAGEVATPPVTLELTRPDRYRFCRAGPCATGRFTLLPVPSADQGRITLEGPAVEAYARALSASRGGWAEAERQRGVEHSIELSYSVGPVGAEISLGVADAAFVKR